MTVGASEIATPQDHSGDRGPSGRPRRDEGESHVDDQAHGNTGDGRRLAGVRQRAWRSSRRGRSAGPGVAHRGSRPVSGHVESSASQDPVPGLVPRREVRHLGPWSAQCVPEQGDWYARQMCIQGHRQYDFHVRTYGHPSKSGFMELDHLWKAEKWDPEQLMTLYVQAGAKYFVSLANHHDNFDTYNSQAPRVEPPPHRPQARHRRHVGQDRPLQHGLRFGREQPLRPQLALAPRPRTGHGEGPLAGVRYDAHRLTKADGKGDVVGGSRSAGPLHGAEHRDAGWRGERQGRGGLAREERPAVDGEGAPDEPGVRRAVVPPVQGSSDL